MCEHFVQFYKNDAFLINEVANYIGPALQAGATGIVIATRRHLDQLEDRLRQDVMPLHPVRCPAGTYLPLDAEDLLSQFMVADWPDAARFNAVMEGVFQQASVGTYERVLAFGEMVALLATAGRHDAALAVETMWNQLAKRHSFTLLCAYPAASLNETSHEAAYRAICMAHSRVWPPESDDNDKRPGGACETIFDAAAGLRDFVRVETAAAQAKARCHQKRPVARRVAQTPGTQ
jgi:hypothetical protein